MYRLSYLYINGISFSFTLVCSEEIPLRLLFLILLFLVPYLIRLFSNNLIYLLMLTYLTYDNVLYRFLIAL